MAEVKNKRKETGIILSDKMSKSRTVYVEGIMKHPAYGKFIKTRKKYMAHDEENKTKAGDRVVIEESTPISKSKRWTIVKILDANKK